MGRKEVISRLKVALLFSIVLAVAVSTPPVKAEDPTLETILNTLGFTNRKESTVETFVPGSYEIKLYAEFALFNGSNELSWYLAGSTVYNLIFSGPEGNFGYVNPPLVKTFAPTTRFGLSFLSTEARYFTELHRNPDGIKHCKIYLNLDDPDMYLIGFENHLGGGDLDYNDMVISLKLTSDVQVDIGGTLWHYRNATNNKVVIPLFGGHPSGGTVWINEIYAADEYSKYKLYFIASLIESGFDILTVKTDHKSYTGTETWVKDAATWLRQHNYGHVFLFGFSGGGVVVAYEIQKDYCSTQYSAAAFCSAPVDWEGYSGIYQSAHTASQDKTSTCFLEGETDLFRTQMQTYYNNVVTDKQWHLWNDGHDIFPYTCKDHPGEEVATAVSNWFNAAHPPNTPLQPSGPSSGYCGYTYTYTSTTIDPNGDNIRYQFSWGDGSYDTTAWVACGTTGSAQHHWDNVGAYQVSVRAQDATERWSVWPPVKTVSITSGGGGGCPFLYVWNGGEYHCEGLLDIHDPSGADVTTQLTLASNSQATQGVYKFQLIEHSQTISHIDQVKLYAILKDGRTIQLPLIYAWHSDKGFVLLPLLFSDDWKVDTLGADHNNGISQSIELRFLALPRNIEVQAFVFQIEGNNPYYKT